MVRKKEELWKQHQGAPYDLHHNICDKVGRKQQLPEDEVGNPAEDSTMPAEVHRLLRRSATEVSDQGLPVLGRGHRRREKEQKEPEVVEAILATSPTSLMPPPLRPWPRTCPPGGEAHPPSRRNGHPGLVGMTARLACWTRWSRQRSGRA